MLHIAKFGSYSQALYSIKYSYAKMHAFSSRVICLEVISHWSSTFGVVSLSGFENTVRIKVTLIAPSCTRLSLKICKMLAA